jgi:2-polyprenyl-3-methyl-5-hydroxy-6-metoxy-1,4-benzoquinol methylase
MVAPTHPTATTPGDLARKMRRELDLALARAKVAGPNAAVPTAMAPVAIDDVRGHLLPISGLLAHKATAKPGLFAFVVRSARRLSKVLIRPWLDFQTRFNHQVIESLTRIVSYRRQTEAVTTARLEKSDTTVAELREQLNQLRAELADQTTAHRQTNTKLGEVSAALRQANAELVKLAAAQQAVPALFREELAGVARTIEQQATAYLHEQVTGRLEQQVAEVTRAADERLAEAKRATDERMPHEIAAAVNRELGHEGSIAQAGLWFNPPIGVRMAAPNTPVVVAITERILEHTFVHTRLPRPPARVLDMGCAESMASLEMASMGYQVVGVDLRRLPLEHPNFTQVQANLGDLPFPDGAFDVVVCLSTVEHVGLGWYTEGDATTDLKAIREAVRTLKPGGTFLLTVPFGRATITPLHRVYDRPQLDELLAPLTVREVAFGVRDGEVWSLTDDEATAERADSAARVSAVALVVAEKPTDGPAD